MGLLKKIAGGRRKYIAVLMMLVVFSSCQNKHPLFKSISSSHSGIDFTNTITESDSLNPLDNALMYNGGGVAVADFNDDGLQDIYFSGNLVKNKLYINKGQLKFEDVTTASGTDGNGAWSGGVAIVDINQDGWEDIYVCTSMKTNGSQQGNILYVNQGADKNGIPHFKEQATEYGLADTGGYNVQAAFFDYDNDGDPDMYLLRTMRPGPNTRNFRPAVNDGSVTNTDKLFRNEWNDSLQHPVYTDVSKAAGIRYEGFGLGLAIADLNQDGWKDIYVANDFNGNDELYINNHDGTFTNKIQEYFKHSSFNAMGNEIADLNNDALPDVVTLDMNAEDNYRKKMNMDGNNYTNYLFMKHFNYELQYVRNTLQLNRGRRIDSTNQPGDPVFSEIGFYAGIAATDWSWSVLAADFDNDGNKDLAITNGYPRDITDHDYAAFLYQQRSQGGSALSKMELVKPIPQIKLPNYVFRNTGDLRFENAGERWGITEPSFSNGAVYADLDNDGDLDYAVSNVNDRAFLYENTSVTNAKNNYLRIKFEGSKQNKDGIGAIVKVYYDSGRVQFFENSPYRGYLSTTENIAHFGLGSISVVDSIQINWGNNFFQTLKNIKAGQTLTVDFANAITFLPNQTTVATLFSNFTLASGINYTDESDDFNDFNIQRLLPHKFSQYGPSLAVGDINNDGRDDVYVGGNSKHPGCFWIQQSNGTFKKQELITGGSENQLPEEMGSLLLDVDNDGDLDLYISSGGIRNYLSPQLYNDKLFINDGKGKFTLAENALPVNTFSKSCVKAADIDHDGDLDLFIGSRFLPGNYPLPVSGIILRNDSKPGQIKFTDVTAQLAPGLKNIGMICDALWTDMDNDGWVDLFITGEWMAPTIFKNNKGRFENITASTGLQNETGWWNSIVAGDFDNDGDIDYVLGNQGENSFHIPSAQYPVSIYAADLDGNGNIDPVMTQYIVSKINDGGGYGVKKEYPSQLRDDIVEQVPVLKKKYLFYKDFAVADINEIIPEEKRKSAAKLKAANARSSFVQNLGYGKFKISPLSAEAQFAPVFGMVADDFDNDGNLDIILNGNEFGGEVSLGLYDAFNGLFLKGDGNGNFKSMRIEESGIYIPGDGKALIKIRTADNKYVIGASQHNGPLQLFQLKKEIALLPLHAMDAVVIYELKNGKKRREEIFYGNSFFSQSGRFIAVSGKVKKITIIDYSGKERLH
jgi:ASPIC and UnbV/FG-GAP-like repeat/FG-GAP repeat